MDYRVNLTVPEVADCFIIEHHDDKSRLARIVQEKLNSYIPMDWSLPQAAEAAGRYVCMYHPDLSPYPEKKFFNFGFNNKNELFFAEQDPPKPYDFLLTRPGGYQLAIDAKLGGNGDHFRISGREMYYAKKFQTEFKKYIVIRVNLTKQNNDWIVRYIFLCHVKNKDVWNIVKRRNTV